MVTIQQLVENHIHFADKLASKKRRALPKFIELDELKSAAYMGLVEAANRYNPELGIEFTTFAYPRIWGAVHDYLRERGWKRGGGDYENMGSLESPCAEGETKDCQIKDTLAARPEAGAAVEECFEAITIRLNESAKKILRHYFIDEHSMKEVGDKFGVSESRISQLIKSYKSEIKRSWEEDSRMELAA